MGDYKGRNVFYINGRPHMPLMYSGTEQGRKTWENPARENIKAFVEAGYTIIQTDMWFKYSLRPDGTFDTPGIQRQLAAILDINRSAHLVVRINVSAPQWWLLQHPEERCVTTKPGPDNQHFGGNNAESLASRAYTEFAHQYLGLFLRELLSLPEADRVIGIHIGGGVYGEWHYYGIFNEPDASRAMQERFRRFVLAKYGSLERIGSRWGNRFTKISDVEVPSYERRYLASDGDFYDPATDAQVIDYYECQQQVISGLVEGLARLVKETWPRRVLTGVFFGYFYGGFTVGAQASQADIRAIFRSPYIDYFAGPYYSRSMYGSGCYRSLSESAALNGKIWLTEHDGGTHLGSSGSGRGRFPDIPENEQQTIARMRRNFMYTITEKGGQWWYDFGPRSQGGGWWNTPGLLREAGQLNSLASALMEKPFKSLSEVLLVHSMYAFYHHRPKKSENLTNLLHEKMADAMLGTGVPFDKIFLMDLDRADLSRYKLIIFANTVVLSDSQRLFIRNEVMKAGRTVVFLSASGYTDGVRNNVSLVSALTGITIDKADQESSPKFTLTLDHLKFPGSAPGVISTFKVTDPAARPVGYYENGEMAAAVKMVNGCRIYYFGIPLGDKAAPFRSLLKEAEIRFYVENITEQDYVSIGGGIIAIYSVKGGDKVLHPLNGCPVRITLQPFTTHYYDVSDGQLLH